jgi:hypothetical protein
VALNEKGFPMSDERPTHAPCFVQPGEPEPRTVGGFGLGDTTDRRTFAVKVLRADEVERIGAEQLKALRQAAGSGR